MFPTVSLIHHCCHTSQLGLIDLQLVHGPARLMLISTFFFFFFSSFLPPLFIDFLFRVSAIRLTGKPAAE